MKGKWLKFRKDRRSIKELIKRGYSRFQEKLKEKRQNFANEVTSGSRSGGGKIVLEFFDQLKQVKQVWGGSLCTEPLSSGQA